MTNHHCFTIPLQVTFWARHKSLATWWPIHVAGACFDFCEGESLCHTSNQEEINPTSLKTYFEVVAVKLQIAWIQRYWGRCYFTLVLLRIYYELNIVCNRMLVTFFLSYCEFRCCLQFAVDNAPLFLICLLALVCFIFVFPSTASQPESAL